MAKEFKQFLEESKQKSAMLRKQKMSKQSGPKLKVVDSDKPTSKRLGGGKRITPSNWLKKPNTPDPWTKSKPKKTTAPKTEKKPVQKKVAQQPTLAQRLKKAGHSFDKKMKSASDFARDTVHAGLERPKQVARVAGSVARTAGKVSAGTAKLGLRSASALTKHMRKQDATAAAHQSKLPVEH